MLNRYQKAIITYDMILLLILNVTATQIQHLQRGKKLRPILIIPIPNNLLAGGAG